MAGCPPLELCKLEPPVRSLDGLAVTGNLSLEQHPLEAEPDVGRSGYL